MQSIWTFQSQDHAHTTEPLEVLSPIPSGLINFQHKRGGAGKLQEGHGDTLLTKVCLVKASSHV